MSPAPVLSFQYRCSNFDFHSHHQHHLSENISETETESSPQIHSNYFQRLTPISHTDVARYRQRTSQWQRLACPDRSMPCPSSKKWRMRFSVWDGCEEFQRIFYSHPKFKLADMPFWIMLMNCTLGDILRSSRGVINTRFQRDAKLLQNES